MREPTSVCNCLVTELYGEILYNLLIQQCLEASYVSNQVAQCSASVMFEHSNG